MEQVPTFRRRLYFKSKGRRLRSIGRKKQKASSKNSPERIIRQCYSQRLCRKRSKIFHLLKQRTINQPEVTINYTLDEDTFRDTFEIVGTNHQKVYRQAPE